MKVNFIEENCNIVNDGQFNMDFDLCMLDNAIEKKSNEAFIRFYQWYPKCVSLGRNQKDEEYYHSLGIDVVRRPSGGRALLHDMELTYCIVCPAFNDSILESYKIISDSLILGFKHLGINLNYGSGEHKNLAYCMNISMGADITYNGKKLIGSAQYRKEGYILQHGSIPYSLDFELIEKIFKQPIDKEKIITLNEIDDSLSTRVIIEALKKGFIEVLEKI